MAAQPPGERSLARPVATEDERRPWPFRRWADDEYRRVELGLVAASLLATVIIALVVWRQAAHHFKLERTTAFAARFNGQEFVKLREDANVWFNSGETPEELFARCDRKDKSALEAFAAVRTYANFFQELGVALKHDTLDEYYAWDIFGSASQRAAARLGPFIAALRSRDKRPGLLTEVASLAQRMRAADGRYGTPSSTVPLQPPSSQPATSASQPNGKGG